jgi:hypothetical protein
VERDDPLPRCLDQLLTELDRLGQDNLFLCGQQGDLADLPEIHPDRVADADHVGRERLRSADEYPTGIPGEGAVAMVTLWSTP